MSEHDHLIASGLIFPLLKCATKRSLHAERVKEIGVYAIPPESFRLIRSREIKKSLGLTDKLLEALTLFLPIGEDADREVLMVEAGLQAL